MLLYVWIVGLLCDMIHRNSGVAHLEGALVYISSDDL